LTIVALWVRLAAVLGSALALAVVVVVREVACGVGVGVEFGQFGFGLYPYAPWVSQ